MSAVGQIHYLYSTVGPGEKALLGFEPRISLLQDRYFDQLSHSTLSFLHSHRLTWNMKSRQIKANMFGDRC